MILLARALVRVVSFLLLVILAIAGLVLAIFCIGTGSTGPSLGGLADVAQLAQLRDTVDSWLAQIEAGGPVAVVAAVCGLGAMVLGVLLLVGILVPRRERLVTLTGDADGKLAARRRPLAQVAQALVEQTRGVTEAKVKVRPRRRTGGIVSVRASRLPTVDDAATRSAVQERLSGLTEPFKLTSRVNVVRRCSRVQ